MSNRWEMWIDKHQDFHGYIAEDKDFYVINAAPMSAVTIIDCDHKDVFIRSAFAVIKTEKGIHLFCPPEVSQDHILQDPKFIRICRHRGFYSLRSHNKGDKKPREMEIWDPDYEWLGKEWKRLVDSVQV